MKKNATIIAILIILVIGIILRTKPHDKGFIEPYFPTISYTVWETDSTPQITFITKEDGVYKYVDDTVYFTPSSDMYGYYRPMQFGQCSTYKKMDSLVYEIFSGGDPPEGGVYNCNCY